MLRTRIWEGKFNFVFRANRFPKPELIKIIPMCPMCPMCPMSIYVPYVF